MPGKIPALLMLAMASPVAAQRVPDARAVRSEIRSWREGNEPRVLGELVSLLEIPNLASDRVGIRRNADSLIAMLGRRGFTTRLLESAAGAPAVFGELRVPGARRTIVLYAHYDGQPVDSAAWRSPPWRAVFRDAPLEQGGREIGPSAGGRYPPEARLFARSSGDDKSPIMAVLAAIDALRASRRALSVNVKLFLEGDEEAGSPHVRELLERNRELLAADAWYFLDGPVHQTRRHQLVYGTRGTQNFQITVYGPRRPLHSGHYGNWAPNPGVLLSHLVTSMRDENGRVLIAGFYDDVRAPTDAERRAIAAMPPVDDQLRAELGLAATEAGNAPLMERLLLPALNVQGLELARVGAGASNVISPSATAAFGFRLVPDQTPARLRDLVRAHLVRQGFHVVESDPDSATRVAHGRIARLTFASGAYRSERTALDAPAAQALVRAVEPALEQPFYHVPTSGGSLPLATFVEVLGVPMITFPTVNHDNNQHGANENLRLQNFWDAIELFGVMLARLGFEWDPRT